MSKITMFKPLKKIITLGLSLSLTVFLTGCVKKMECSDDKNGILHLHKYVSTDGCTTYFQSEDEYYEGYRWTDNVIYINEEDKALYDFLDQNNLVSISDNQEVIRNFMETEDEYIEYQYKYTDRITVGYVKLSVTKTSFSREHQSRETGIVRKAYKTYIGYRIVMEDGKYKLVPNEPVRDLTMSMERYPYFNKDNFYIQNNGLEYQIDNVNQR